MGEPGNKKGLIVVLSGPSGVGKSTVSEELLRISPNVVRSISCTTRAPRGGEADGIDYFFVSRENFEREIECDRFAEYAKVFGEYYGTPCEFLESTVKEGRDCLLVIDIQGGLQIKERYPEALLLFLLPPGEDELQRRLRFRHTDSETEIDRRIEEAKHEMRVGDQYDEKVVNDDVGEAARRISEILQERRQNSP